MSSLVAYKIKPARLNHLCGNKTVSPTETKIYVPESQISHWEFSQLIYSIYSSFFAQLVWYTCVIVSLSGAPVNKCMLFLLNL